MSPTTQTKAVKSAFHRGAAAAAKKKLQEEVEPLAQKMSLYCRLQQESSNVLAQDVTRRDKMLAMVAQSHHPNVSHTLDPNAFGSGEKVDELLAQYDAFFAQTPVTYEDHFLRFSYATAAAIMFDEHKVAPLARRGDKEQLVYIKRMNELMDEWLKPMAMAMQTQAAPVSPQNAPNDLTAIASSGSGDAVTDAEANTLLNSPGDLLKQWFVQIFNLSEDDKGVWKVKSLTMKDDGRFEYEVLLADYDATIVVTMDELRMLMMESRLSRM
ncbi:uncharacterized protein LAESUDRAFT_757161 [Laetiporus sulphureus 93-53]|uniref:Uncharacterized protein n=1 Tax=Laetiporus sulphureus 93-53 TaxID=1314785 RepID=A0A165FHF2_9APHY|nr:uncharacterized protein LAESUDRAFT_757161 [Laetiporus sulphureus 93-53]KZT08976.1 hypothetical protein LAESUDRAFT_757161 [Laetiporus sulphureus 93-53]